ncbi:hypothetical protein BLNAU_10009 [Blattamonas nauphoetae]|uniref:Uncharacterized protein n=1 Tax=Blattamonas nauphoetae TaxID=2049346 RepID=A0ABQ9XUB9_9EUKA|nr:hypothetical protein BLNAU_10009 [Blattamonas nauphoetae]
MFCLLSCLALSMQATLVVTQVSHITNDSRTSVVLLMKVPAAASDSYTLFYRIYGGTREMNTTFQKNSDGLFQTGELNTNRTEPSFQFGVTYELMKVENSIGLSTTFTAGQTYSINNIPTLKTVEIKSEWLYIQHDGISPGDKLVNHQFLLLTGTDLALTKHTLTFSDLDLFNVTRSVEITFTRDSGGSFLLLPADEKTDTTDGLIRNHSYQLVSIKEENSGPLEFARSKSVTVLDLPPITRTNFPWWIIPVIIVVVVALVVVLVVVVCCVKRSKSGGNKEKKPKEDKKTVANAETEMKTDQTDPEERHEEDEEGEKENQNEEVTNPVVQVEAAPVTEETETEAQPHPDKSSSEPLKIVDVTSPQNTQPSDIQAAEPESGSVEVKAGEGTEE